MKKTLLIQFVVMLMCFQLSAQRFNRIDLPAGLEVGDAFEKAVYRGHLYMVLSNDDEASRQLYRYNGSGFSLIPLPEGYRLGDQHQFEVFQDKLYMFLNDGTNFDLFNYDGTFTRVDIPFPDWFALERDQLIVFQDKLYFSLLRSSGELSWCSYDGYGHFSLIAPLEGASGYFLDREVYHGKMYVFNFNERTYASSLLKFDGTSFEVVALPDEDLVLNFSADMAVYDDKLFIPFTTDGDPSRGLLAFDGTSFTVFEFPAGITSTDLTMTPFRGKLFLLLHNGPSSRSEFFSFDGIDFTPIPLPMGVNGPFEACVYQCSLYGGIRISGENRLYAFGPFDGCHVFSVPAGMLEYDRFEFTGWGTGIPECWTGIDVDWDIDPICISPPLCPDPLAQATLLDKNGKPVWSKEFEKPFSVSLPSVDLPSQLSLGIENDNTIEKVLQFDANLVSAGIEQIHMEVKPSENFFRLSAQTSKGKTVPFAMTLIGADGKAMWEENFVAPMDKIIEPKSSGVGAFLTFAAAGQNSLASKGITEIKHYPNPVDDKLNLEVQTKNAKVPFQLTITDFNGGKVVQKQLTAPLNDSIDLTRLRPGLYVLTITVEDVSIRELLQVK